jgi:hypothetical protein
MCEWRIYTLKSLIAFTKEKDFFHQRKIFIFHDVIIQCNISEGFTEENNRLSMAFIVLLQNNCYNGMLRGKRE